MKTIHAFVSISFLFLTCCQTCFSQSALSPELAIKIGPDGRLDYETSPNGDRVPDYSYCGYMLSETPIPNVGVKIIVPAMKGDATETIQRAINYVSSLPTDNNGFRGTVLLEKGSFQISGTLTVSNSGVVLRGSGSDSAGTILMGAGTDRQTLIRITGASNRLKEKAVPVASKYLPVNTTILPFTTPHNFKPGDRVIVNRPSTKQWIETIGAHKIGIYVDYQLTKWDAGDFDQNWYRTVTATTPETVTLDVPLTNSLDPRFGGGNVAKYSWPGQISQVGVENLRCVSTYDALNSKDENHRWMAITMDNVRDSWVRRMVAQHFVSSAVAVWESASRITVEDCKSLSPVGEIGNHRRYSFHTLGQQVLFQRCYAEYGYHAFSVGFTAAGPNAFLQCYSYLPYHFSGAIGGWATGVLFDKLTIDGGNLSLAYRDVDGQGGGWSAANSLSWQTRAAQLHLDSPPGAQNWAYGSWAQGYGNGLHERPRSFLKPESIFYAQLEARTGSKSAEQEKILTYESDRSTALAPETAALLSERSRTPDLVMETWIDSMIRKYPLESDVSLAKKAGEFMGPTELQMVSKVPSIRIENGWLVHGNKVLTGRKNRTSLWRGTTRPIDLNRASPNLVRFVPGRMGRGLTDDLDSLVTEFIRNRVVMMQNFPALWYERRRDDHARTRRADADVWAPFYEQPFSRSGQGEAFDRLSKYDLTKWNSWYWLRLKQFADKADEKGLLFIQEHYLQHNIIEEGAHWADYPWRTANNINKTGFAENTAYAGDKRVFMSVEFYDTSHPVRKVLHRNYIRKNLEHFKGNHNVMHHLGVEYTGPLHFVQFWLDVIGEWQRENHQDVMVLLPGTKDVQDAILADPRRAQYVDAIDVLQWHYRQDSSLFAPVGGQSLAPRQYERIIDAGQTSFGQVYRAVSELRDKNPGKAVVYSRGGGSFAGWAAFMGGGSLAGLPEMKDPAFLEEASKMAPLKRLPADTQQYVLGTRGTAYIIYNDGGNAIDLSGEKGNFRFKWVNPSTGEMIASRLLVSGGKRTIVKPPFKGPWVAWLRRK